MANLESYAHRTAKEIMAGWLREEAEKAGHDNYVRFGSLLWRVNRAGPAWGVWVEYPFASPEMDLVWDEVSDRWDAAPPTKAELRAMMIRPLRIADIAVQHKGYISAVIEISHKHHLTKERAEQLHRMGVEEVFQVPTKWVLGQVRKPDGIPASFLYSGVRF